MTLCGCAVLEGKVDRMTETAVKTVWDRHRIWSLVAEERKSKVTRFRLVVLYLIIAGAALQTLATQLPAGGWIAALVGGVCLGFVPIITSRHLGRDKTNEWTRSRSASEGIKAEVYSFRAGAAPYGGGDKVDLLVTRVEEITAAGVDLNNFYAMHKSDGKPPPPPLDRNGYIQKRVKDQVDGYYRKTARRLAKKAKQLRNAEYALATIAAMIGLIVGSVGGVEAVSGDGAASNGGSPPPEFVAWVRGNIGVWVAVLTTAAAATTAHIAASRLDEQVSQYLATAQRLENLLLRLSSAVAPDSPEWSEFVKKCEDAISAQNQAWMAVHTEEPAN